MLAEPKCWTRKCKHYVGVFQLDGTEISERNVCKAYAEMIPNEITYGDDLHLRVRSDQSNAIVYEKAAEDEQPPEYVDPDEMTTQAEIREHSVQINNYIPRTEMHQGHQHVVVPVVMMVEGVHTGSAGPILHLADEMGKVPDAWNGVPVVVSHPEARGRPVSANSPSVIDAQAVGRVYNVHLDGSRLKGEVWVDENKCQEFFPEVLECIAKRRPIEVSVGVFSEDEPAEGEWNGEAYKAVARNYRPDHLALLFDAEGACSWADGCGIRANACYDEETGCRFIAKTMAALGGLRYRGVESASWAAPTLRDFDVSSGRWEDLTSAEKAEVASHFLIGDATVETFGNLRFPVVDPKNGRLNENALRAVIGGRGAQLASVPAEVRDAARRRAYRLLNSEFDAKLEIPDAVKTQMKGGDDDVMKKRLEVLKELAREGAFVVLSPQANERGYRELVGALQAKLDRMDDDAKVHYLVEVFDDDFIYEVRPCSHGEAPAPASMHNGGVTYRRGYAWDEETGVIEFTGEPTRVTRKVEFVDAPTTMMKRKEGGKVKMTDNGKCSCSGKVDLLIQSEGTKFSEDDRVWLSALTEEQLDKLAPEEKKKSEKAAVVTQEQAIEVLRMQLSDPTKFLNLLAPDVREQMEYGLRLHKAQREELVERIASGTQVFAKEELASKSTEELSKLAMLVKPSADYSAYAAGGGGDEGKKLLPAGVGDGTNGKN